VTLTGSGASSLTLRIAGAKAAHGTVTLRSGGRLAGTLDGHRITVRLSTSARTAKLKAHVAELAR
jgi:hypothetical protein